VHGFDVVMVEGSLDVNDLMIETPGFGIEECPGSTEITGTIDDTTGTVAGTYEVFVPFVSPVDSQPYVAEVIGTSTSHGTYNAGAEQFTGLEFGDNTFTISEFDTETCQPSTEVCMGTSTFTFDGGLHNGATLPLSTGEQIYINGAGEISNVTFATCPSFVWFFLLNGASLTLGPNTGASPTPPGAIFEQE